VTNFIDFFDKKKIHQKFQESMSDNSKTHIIYKMRHRHGLADAYFMTEIDPDRIRYGDPIFNDNGSKRLSAQYNSYPITIEFGPATSTSGLVRQDASLDEYSLTFSVDGSNTDLQRFSGLDNAVVEYAFRHSEMLFGVKHSREIIKKLYVPIVKRAYANANGEITFTVSANARTKKPAVTIMTEHELAVYRHFTNDFLNDCDKKKRIIFELPDYQDACELLNKDCDVVVRVRFIGICFDAAGPFECTFKVTHVMKRTVT